MPQIYTKPVIKRFQNKWYVEYYYRNPFYKQRPGQREFKRFKVYEWINKYSDADREKYAAELRDAVELTLQKGYDPFAAEVDLIAEEQKKYNEATLASSLSAKGENMTVALEHYLAAKIRDGITPKSIQGYQTPINHFNKWLAEKNWLDKGVKEFTELDIRAFLTHMQETAEWSGKTYNNNKNHISMWFTWFALEEYISATPLTGRIKSQKTQSVKNEYYSGKIRPLVKAALAKDPLLEWASSFIYYAAVRSYQELSKILIEDIDLENRVIKIKGHVGKTGYRFVPISDELYSLLEKKNIYSQNLKFFLFGKNGEISDKPLDKNFLSRRYYNLRKSINIGQEYTLYSWKHTRVVDLKTAGYTDAEIQDLTGHTDSKSYDTYSRNFGTNLNTSLKGKTISF